MPVYESTKHADNKIKISAKNRDSAVFGWDKVITALAEKKAKTIAIDGWYGINYEKIAKALAAKIGGDVELIDATKLYVSRDEIIAYNQPYVTDDPGFGKVNKTGVIEDIMDKAAVADAKARLSGGNVAIIYGVGAAIKEFADVLDVKCYVDNTHQKVQWDMQTGKLIAFGCTEPTKNYSWKEYHYSDYYMLARQKNYMYGAMDFYIENFFADDLVLVPKAAYDEIMSTLVKYPIHEVKIFSPGPWGAYRYEQMDYGVEGLANNAWNKIAGPELRILIDFGGERSISMPMLNAMQYGEELVGSLINKQYPGLFPLDIWLDDGWHPTPQPAERISMPMHMLKGIEVMDAIPEKNEKLEKLINLGRFIAATVLTGIHAIEWHLLKCKMNAQYDKESLLKTIEEMEDLLSREEENARVTIPVVEMDSRIGWEPSMCYLGDKKHIEWKLRQLQYVRDFEIVKVRKGIER